MNTILKKYKYKQTFLIVRKISGLLNFTINDDYELDTNFNDNEGIQFLKENKNKILKIFINHTLFHSIYFLNSLIKLEKDITTITHDYYLINDNPQPYFHEIQDIDKKIFAGLPPMIFVKKEGTKIVDGQEVPITTEGRSVTRSKFLCRKYYQPMLLYYSIICAKNE